MCSHLRLVVDQNTHVFPLTPVGCGPEHSCVPTNLLFFCVSVFLLLLVVFLLPACFMLSCCRLHSLYPVRFTGRRLIIARASAILAQGPRKIISKTSFMITHSFM